MWLPYTSSIECADGRQQYKLAAENEGQCLLCMADARKAEWADWKTSQSEDAERGKWAVWKKKKKEEQEKKKKEEQEEQEKKKMKEEQDKKNEERRSWRGNGARLFVNALGGL